MKNIRNQHYLNWMSSGYLFDNQFFTPPHAGCKHVVLSLFLLLIAFAVCGCKSDHEPLPTEPVTHVSSPAPAAGADSIMSVLEEVGSWHVTAILQTEGCFSYNLSTDGTMAYFANGEVTFAVPYTSVSFDDDSETTTDYEQYGPYPVSCLSSSTLTIADVSFLVSPSANGCTLKSKKTELQLGK